MNIPFGLGIVLLSTVFTPSDCLGSFLDRISGAIGNAQDLESSQISSISPTAVPNAPRPSVNIDGKSTNLLNGLIGAVGNANDLGNSSSASPTRPPTQP